MELLEPRTRARRYSWVTERSARSGQPQAPPDPKYRDLVLTETRMHAERVTKARRRRATRRIRLGRPSSIRSRPTDPPGRASWRRDQAAASRSGGGRCDASEAALDLPSPNRRGGSTRDKPALMQAWQQPRPVMTSPAPSGLKTGFHFLCPRRYMTISER